MTVEPHKVYIHMCFITRMSYLDPVDVVVTSKYIRLFNGHHEMHNTYTGIMHVRVQCHAFLPNWTQSGLWSPVIKTILNIYFIACWLPHGLYNLQGV